MLVVIPGWCFPVLRCTVDDMAERCDRLEAELMLNDTDGRKLEGDANQIS